MRTLPLRTDFAPDTFAPFGTVIDRPGRAGERQFFSDWLGSEHPGCAPVLHTNLVVASALPQVLSRLEHHPHASQAFVPLDVCRYIVVVAPSDAAGRPVVDGLEAFIVPGNFGVIYRHGVWHAGASVLDRDGSFAVLMWRGAPDDDVFADIEPVALVEAATALRGVI